MPYNKAENYSLEEQDEIVKQLFRLNVNIIAIFDIHGVLKMFNSGAENLTGYSAEEVIGKPIWDTLIPPEFINDVKNVVHNLKQNQLKIAERHENPWLTKSGERISISWHNTVLHDGQGLISHILTIGFDISKQKNYEQLIKEQNENLELMVKSRTLELEKTNEALVIEKKKVLKAKQAKSDFFAKMSHELRTPMHGIISYASMGIRKISDLDDNKKLRYFTNIKSSADRLLLLINDLLDYSKLESGKMQMNFTQTDLKSVVDSCILELHARLEENAQITAFTVETSGSQGQFDRLRIGQVITNLLSNAIKFSPHNKKIELSIKNAEIKGNESRALKFSIRDYGDGIKEQEQYRIFNMFEQASNDILSKKGTGLGLAISRDIIELHHGKIWTENHPEGGAIFSFIIPVEQPEIIHPLRRKDD
ncbi:MAG: PAS domain-containing sensor histidine kinase [Gammaproteobacteria bacterium]|nr:PAS domain-containing sensor histidine kinase [Gammaproteobacteria bacterium]